MPLRTAPASESQLELFTAMFTDIATRDSREAMELPFLSLSKTPRFDPIIYRKDDIELVVTGGAPIGIANIWDWDLMMWLMSQIRQGIDQGRPVSRKISFHRHSFLKDARRGQGGSQYKQLEEAISRLKNTNIVTTIRAEGSRKVMFSWIEYAAITRDKLGNLSNAVVVLPEWLFEAVSNKSLILSLHRDYFLLTGGLERWLYRLIRKGAGSSAQGWKWTMQSLYERSGSAQEFKYFARDLRRLTDAGSLLDYRLAYGSEAGVNYISARRLATQPEQRVVEQYRTKRCSSLTTETFERAKHLAPGYDVYALEADWAHSCDANGVTLKNPDAAFLGWCRAVHRRRPL